MPRVSTVKPRVNVLGSSRVTMDTTEQRRMTGRALQARRLRIWVSNPHCAGCGRLTKFPDGFELDHKIALLMGGPDTDDNCQVLCVSVDGQGRKVGCHIEKSASELQKAR